MVIAVLSGKGGTGKTLVSVNLAAVANESVYIDCDVEEPNGHLFFKPEGIEEETISVKIPLVDQNRCTGCRACVTFCQFNALAYINKQLTVFEEMCHSCGGCMIVCQEQAISEKEKIVGAVKKGMSENVSVFSGILNTGEASGIPIIKKLLSTKILESESIVFIDCPPGSACIVMESIKEADYCILVAEPTIFGVHNLTMVHELVTLFNKPFGVVLNKCMEGDNPAERYCFENNLPILDKIKFDKELGMMNSDARIVARETDKYHQMFSSLLKKVANEVKE